MVDGGASDALWESDAALTRVIGAASGAAATSSGCLSGLDGATGAACAVGCAILSCFLPLAMSCTCARTHFSLQSW